MKKIQIGVMGSMADKTLDESLKTIAAELGKEIAQHKAFLVFGYEGDFNSLSQIAAESAEKNGGETLAFVWGNKKTPLGSLKSTTIITGTGRGGGREFPLVLSCDAIICIGGGSGTLTEIAMAYQANIPIIVIENTGGWSEKLADTFLDARKRQKIIKAKNPQEAVKRAIASVSIS